MKVYAFKYCDCVHEGGSQTRSIHMSYNGAENAMKKHKQAELEEYNDLWKDEEPYYPFGDMSLWYIEEIDILP